MVKASLKLWKVNTSFKLVVNKVLVVYKSKRLEETK